MSKAYIIGFQMDDKLYLYCDSYLDDEGRWSNFTTSKLEKISVYRTKTIANKYLSKVKRAIKLEWELFLGKSEVKKLQDQTKIFEIEGA